MPNRPLFGRDRELGAAERLLDDVLDGKGGTIVVRGEPGSGKSRLADEIQSLARARRFKFFAGSAVEYEADLPYALSVRLFAALTATDLAAADSPDLVRSVTTASLGARPRSPTQAARGNAATAAMLRTMSLRTPLLLFADDVHWADGSTLELLETVAGHASTARYAVVVAAAHHVSTADGARWRVLDRIEHAPASTVVELSPLDRRATQEMLSDTVGVPTDDLVDEVTQLTAGNPFFIEQVAAALADAGLLVETSDGLALRPGAKPAAVLPAGARSSVLHRLLAAGRGPFVLAQHVAILERVTLGGATEQALRQLVPLGAAELDAALVHLIDQGIVTIDNSTMSFAHGLVRSILYEELGPVRRRTLHRAAAAALEEAESAGMRVDAAILGHHLAAGAREGDADAILRLRNLAEATANHAPAVAVRWYDAALALTAGADEHDQIAARRLRCLLWSDNLADAVHAARSLHGSLPFGAERDAVACIGATALAAAGRIRESDEFLSAARPASSSAGSARLDAHHITNRLYQGRLHAALDSASSLLTGAELPMATRAQLLREKSQAELLLGDVKAFRATLREALEATSGGPHHRRIGLSGWTGHDLALAGEIDEARVMLEEASQLCDDFGYHAYEPLVDLGWGMLHWLAGDWARAATAIKRAQDEARRSDRVIGTAYVSPAEVAMLIDRGSVAEARSVLDTAQQARRVNGYHLFDGLLTSLDVLLECVLGRSPAEELNHLLGALEEGCDDGGRHLVLDTLAEVLPHDAPEPEIGRLLRLADDLETFEAPLPSAVRRRVRLRLTGDLDAGAEAIQILDGAGLIFHRATTQLELGIRRHDGDSLREAHSELERIGAARLARSAASALRALGAPVPRSGKHQDTKLLTDLESRIAELVGSGLTNVEVAEALFISRKTVENYLTRVYRKTGCRNRTELAADIAAIAAEK